MSTVIPKEERSSYWDNIKGILMLFVVFAHILYKLQDKFSVIDSTVDYIYMFHMPAFVFVSGYFGKSKRSQSFEGIIKLIFLYFIFNTAIGFIFGFASLLTPLYSYWYLVALIVWRLSCHRIAKFKEINLILFIIALFAGFYPSIDNTLSAARIICFYPYYMLGFKLSKEKSEELENKPYLKRAGIGALCIIAAAIVAFCAKFLFHFSDQALLMAPYEEHKDAIGRIMLYVVAFLMIYALRCLSPDKKIPLLTSFGRNSLWIFIIHRPITIAISDFIDDFSLPLIILLAVVYAFILCLISGNDYTSKYMDKFLTGGADIFLSDKKKFTVSKLASLCIALLFVFSAVKSIYADLGILNINSPISNEEQQENNGSDILYPVMTKSRKQTFDNAFRITFAGDLILLEDQVKRAYNGEGYDFSDVFEYAKPYIESADLAIGVFEGPMAGEQAGYTSSNYGDGKELYLSFPDEFAQAVKDAGFDLVTNANNHLLDKGENGALRTIEILDKIGLDHTGSYSSAEDKEKNRVKLIECQGIKMAVLSYTYGSNYYDNVHLVNGGYSYLTSVISGTEGEMFEKLKQNVYEDFQKAKSLSPDLIIVLPHIGTQFSNAPDEEQKVWFSIFKEYGADIILGDHPHVVEPVTIENYNGRTVYTAYCPGNFANIYRENQGDTSMLTDVYIDRETKKVIGGSIVPLYTHSPADGNFRAVPIYEIMNNTELRKQLTTDDIELAANANSIITKVVLGNQMDITAATERYYIGENGFLRTKATGLKLSDEMKKGTLYTAMEKADTICFVGDSVTEGTKNGGCGWYEPIEEYFPDKVITNYSKGGCTVSYMIDRTEEIPTADLYVIALGTNDVRYRNENKCAMTAQSYTMQLSRLREKLLEKSPDADFVFIAPWYSIDGDPYCKMSFREKTALNDEYSKALEEYCLDNSLKMIDPNEYIKNVLAVSPDKKYLLDHIHPNSTSGVVMYSEAVLSQLAISNYAVIHNKT